MAVFMTGLILFYTTGIMIIMY